MDTTAELLEQNALIEVQDWLINELDRKVEDLDLTDPELDKTTKENRRKAALRYVSTYIGTNDFVQDLRSRHLRGMGLSVPQLRGALNVLRVDLQRGRIKVAKRDGLGKPIATVSSVTTVDPETKAAIEAETPKKEVIAGEVIESKEKSILDLSGLPDGRYAVPIGSATTKQYVYLRVVTKRNVERRTKRYRWSKFTHGLEIIPAGTVEVREAVGSTKRLLGEQLPGQAYTGEYIDELSHILQNPELYALMFSMTFTKCSICGRDLTDTISTELNIGPECEKKYGPDYWARFSTMKAAEKRREAVAAAAAGATT